MKIGIDARLWNESGVGRYIRNLVSGIELRNTTHDFTIFLNREGYRQVSFTNPSFKKVLAKSKWHTISEQWEFKRIVDKEDLDLMHFPYFSYPIFYNKPYVVTVHDLIIDHYPTGMASSLPLPLYYLKHAAYKKIIATAVKKSKAIISPSYATKEELIDHYKADSKKVQVVYEGFDPLIKKTPAVSKLVSSNYILYVGNAYPHKNLNMLLSAFSSLPKDLGLELVCIGKSDFFYKRLIANKTKGVHFLHDVDDSELFDYYTNAKMLVMPSLMEGFGLPVLEAMNLSCPVVCSNTRIFQEICGEAAYYFSLGKDKDLIHSITAVASDRKLSDQLIAKGKEQAKKFSWERCVSETLKIYESSNSV